MIPAALRSQGSPRRPLTPGHRRVDVQDRRAYGGSEVDARKRLTRSRREARVGEGPGGPPIGRSETVRVELLGGFRVSVGTRTVEEGAWQLRKAANLVKLPALVPGHRIHRERVMDLLWPDLGRRAAANNLSQALHAARRAFEAAPKAASRYLDYRDEQLVMCPEGELWVNVEAFEAAATARRARGPAAYRAALELYAELLPGDPYEDWAEGRREGLRRLFLSLLAELSGLHEERGEYGAAAEALRRAVAEEPTHEEAHLDLMRLYALSGRRGEALTQYERLEEVLCRQLATEPGIPSRRLYEEIASGRFAQAPPSLGGSSIEETAGRLHRQAHALLLPDRRSLPAATRARRAAEGNPLPRPPAHVRHPAAQKGRAPQARAGAAGAQDHLPSRSTSTPTSCRAWATPQPGRWTRP